MDKDIFTHDYVSEEQKKKSSINLVCNLKLEKNGNPTQRVLIF